MTDEAKRCVEALRICCSQNDCRDCKFMEADVDESSCVDVLFHNSADLIESLTAQLEKTEQERDGLNILLSQAQAMLETRTKERDAAVADLREADMIDCMHCKAYNANIIPCQCDCENCKIVNCVCKTCVKNSNWQWRGVEVQHGI